MKRQNRTLRLFSESKRIGIEKARAAISALVLEPDNKPVTAAD